MFLEHFGLKTNPFGVTADARYLYFGREHRDALAAMYLSVLEGRGIGALIAHAGMGKTTLLRYLASRLQGKAVTAFLSHPYRGRHDLMRDVLDRLGLQAEDSEFHQMARLQGYLRNLLQRRTKVVLLFDECQALRFEALEQIRLLSNLRSSNMNMLEIVLAGQEEFEDELRLEEHEALRQRISVLATIRPFDEAEVARYIERRLRLAGCEKTLFDAQSIAELARISNGVPRNINHIAYKAMALAWADGDETISVTTVGEAARDLVAGEGRMETTEASEDADRGVLGGERRHDIEYGQVRPRDVRTEPSLGIAAKVG